jgi:hypothetical protein
MKRYIGTKVVEATPMTRLDYNNYRNWTLPLDEDGSDDGYLVEYTDGGKGNDSRHSGYISWSPKEQFDAAYRSTTGMSFGLAIESLKMGNKVARAGWNGKGMWLSLIQAAQWQVSEDVPGMDDDSLLTLPWIGMRTADCKFVPWLASQTDVLSEDWVLV